MTLRWLHILFIWERERAGEKKEHIQTKCISKHPRTHRANMAKGKRLARKKKRARHENMYRTHGLSAVVRLLYLSLDESYTRTNGTWNTDEKKTVSLVFSWSFCNKVTFYDERFVRQFSSSSASAWFLQQYILFYVRLLHLFKSI